MRSLVRQGHHCSLASYEQVLVDVLATVTGGGATPALNTFIALESHFNDSEVAKRKAIPIQDVLMEFTTTHQQVLSLITTIPADTLREVGTLPWYGSAYALDDLIVYMYYGHKREHSAQIAAFRDHQSRCH